MPTGSLAPDSPSMITPARPRTSRLPSTENTTAGSVGASAVPSSSASGQATPNSACASAAIAAAVSSVPKTPTRRIGVTATRSLRTPMPIPPSNRIMISATVTTFSTVSTESPFSAGMRSEAAAAPTRKIAGAGMRSRLLILLDSSATDTATATMRRVNPNGSMLSTTRRSIPPSPHVTNPGSARAPD